MTDPAPPPPKKPAGPAKFILLGCGILTGILILGMGGCFTIFYFVHKGTEPIAEVGAEYLRKSTRVQDALGTPLAIQRHKLGTNVRVVNDGGNARITYTARGSRGEGEAVVWLVKSQGQWSAVGARVRGLDGTDVEVGKPPRESHRIDWDD